MNQKLKFMKLKKTKIIILHKVQAQIRNEPHLTN